MLAAPSLLLFLILVGTDAASLIKGPLNNPNCGVVPKAAPIQKRMIVGGSEAQPEAWPWQIAVQIDDFRFCGGTLISSEFVLTAAHCVMSKTDPPRIRDLSIIAGEYNLAWWARLWAGLRDRLWASGDRQERLVARAFVHPEYRDNSAVYNDIALLKLDRPLQLNPKVWPACLPSQGEELKPQTNATIIGWGYTFYRINPDGEKERERTRTLHEARVPVANDDVCKSIYGQNFVSDQMVCVGYKKGQVDVCFGDSGGPLLVERDNRWYVYGITSMVACGQDYSSFCKTSSYINWINQTCRSSV